MAELKPTTEQRAWNEYLAWTRGAATGQYAETEERAWSRLQRAVLALRIRPYTLREPQREDVEQWENFPAPLSDDPSPRA